MNVARIGAALADPTASPVEAMMAMCEVAEGYTMCLDLAAQREMTKKLQPVLPLVFGDAMLNVVSDTPLLFLFVRLYRHVVSTTPSYPLGVAVAGSETTLMSSIVPGVLRMRDRTKLSEECRILLRLIRLKHRSHFQSEIMRTYPSNAVENL